MHMCHIVVLSLFAAGALTGCTSSKPKAPPVQARTVEGTAVLLNQDRTWVYDADLVREEPTNAVIVCGWTPGKEYEGILNNDRLVGEGLAMGIPVYLSTTVDVPGTFLRNASGILLRGDISRGVRQELLNQVSSGRRAIVFLNLNTIDDDARGWLYDELGVVLLRTEPYHLTDGSAIAYFCQGLETDLGTFWRGEEWDIFAETELKVSDEWSREGIVNGRVYSAYRNYGDGELIITAVGADPYTMLRSTPVDDGAIERADNLEIARRMLHWLSRNEGS